MLTKQSATFAMVANYDKARAQLLTARPELFGKILDNKSRKLSLKMAGVELPEGITIAWATPAGWGHGRDGYRATNAAGMAGK